METSLRPKTTVVDVASIDVDESPTGLYVLKDKKVTALRDLLKMNGAPILVRTEGLTEEQKADLLEQNLQILYIREIPEPGGMWGFQTKEKYAGTVDETFGTKVVPYIVVDETQAKSISNIAAAQVTIKPSEPQPPRIEIAENVELAYWDVPGC